MKPFTVSLLIFTRDEIDGIKSIYPKIPFDLFDEVIAIDGQSTDGTVEFLQEKGIRVIEQKRIGRGNAAIEGVAQCSGEVVVLLSADGNEKPADIPKLLETIRDADIAVASRFMKGGSSDDSDDPIRIRKYGNKMVTALVNLLWGTHLTDSTNGLRAVRRKAWDRLGIDSPYHETEFQMAIRAAKLGMKIAEIPTTEGQRVGGTRYASTTKMARTFLKSLMREIRIGTRFGTSVADMKPRVRAHFDSISSIYQRRKREAYLRLVKKSIGEVPPGRIVDLGCGTGFALSWFEGDKVGVDFSSELLRQGPPGPEYVVADIEATPFRDESFDTVLCLDVLEHLPTLNVIDEAHRILVPHGTLHLSTADRGFELVMDILERANLKLPEGPHQWRKTEEITNKLGQAGFKFDHRLNPPIRFFKAVKAGKSALQGQA